VCQDIRALLLLSLFFVLLLPLLPVLLLRVLYTPLVDQASPSHSSNYAGSRAMDSELQLTNRTEIVACFLETIGQI
jgi:hypothetical protein